MQASPTDNWIIGVNSPMVFLADLVSIYSQRLVKLGIETPHKCKRKDLKTTCGLTAYTNVRFILLAF